MTVYRHQGNWTYDFWKNGVRNRKSGYETKEKARIAETEARKNLRGMNTDFIALCESRLKELELRRTDKYFKENKKLIENLVLKWGKKKEIKREDVEEYLNEVAVKSHFVANKELRLIKALFNHGVEREWFYYNPAGKIKKFSVDKKKKYIPGLKDIRKVLKKASAEDRLYLLVVAHTLSSFSENPHSVPKEFPS